MRILMIVLCLTVLGASAQSKKVTESVSLTGQKIVDLEFTFADNIVFKTWDKKEVLVEVEVNINNGKHNDIFTLESHTTSSAVHIAMDKDMWKKIKWEEDENCNWRSDIDYTVHLPKGMEIRSNTISGDYQLEYFGTPVRLKTISGEIDMTVPSRSGLDFKAKTISGEVFSDLEITYPYGKKGLRQIVGQNVRGRISDGGEESHFETISGNIYLRGG